MARNRGKVIF